MELINFVCMCVDIVEIDFLTSRIYDGFLKRSERERAEKKSDEWETVLVIMLYLLSLFVCCGLLTESQVGMRRLLVCVCVHVHVCMCVGLCKGFW